MGSFQKALQAAYDEYASALFSCAIAVTKSRELAEDAVHDAFCRLLRLENAPRNLKAYVFRSVRNAAVDLVRRAPPTQELEEDAYFDFSDNPREAAEKSEFQRRAARAFQQLSDEEREAVMQHLYAGLKFREIAAMADVSINTVTSHYRRGLEKLKSLLEE